MGHVSWGEAPSDIPRLYWGSGEVNLPLLSFIIRLATAPTPSPTLTSLTQSSSQVWTPWTPADILQRASHLTSIYNIYCSIHPLGCLLENARMESDSPVTTESYAPTHTLYSLWHASRGVIYLYIPSPSSFPLILPQSTYILSRFMNSALCEIDNAAVKIDCVSF